MWAKWTIKTANSTILICCFLTLNPYKMYINLKSWQILMLDRLFSLKVKQVFLPWSYWYILFLLLSHPRSKLELMVRRLRKGPSITAAVVGNTRGKNTNIAASTKSTNTQQRKTRTRSASIVTNIGNINAKRPPPPPKTPPSAWPATGRWNLLRPPETRVWTTGPCWRTWRSRGPWSKLNWTASWWRGRFSLAWAWSCRGITPDPRRTERRGSETENSVQGAAQVNSYLPEGKKVGNLEGTQQMAVNPSPSVAAGASLQIKRLRRQSRTRGPKAARKLQVKTEAEQGAGQKTENSQPAQIASRKKGSPIPLPASGTSRRWVAPTSVRLLSEKKDQTRTERADAPNRQSVNGRVAWTPTATNGRRNRHPRTLRWGKRTAPLTDEEPTAQQGNAAPPPATETPITPRPAPQTGLQNILHLEGLRPGERAVAHWTPGGGKQTDRTPL